MAVLELPEAAVAWSAPPPQPATARAVSARATKAVRRERVWLRVFMLGCTARPSRWVAKREQCHGRLRSWRDARRGRALGLAQRPSALGRHSGRPRADLEPGGRLHARAPARPAGERRPAA